MTVGIFQQFIQSRRSMLGGSLVGETTTVITVIHISRTAHAVLLDTVGQNELLACWNN